MPNRARCSAASIRRTPSATRWPRSSSKPAGCCGTAGTTTRSSPTRRPGASSGRAASMCPISRASTSRSRAALNVPRPPQGHPVLIQAGSSGPGQALAARIADVVFTAQNDLDRGAGLLHGDEGAGGRSSAAPADSALVMPGVFPVIGRTEARGAGDLRRAQPQHRHGAGLHGAVRAAGHRHVGLSAGRAGACPARDRASQEPRRAPAGDGAAREAHPARSSSIGWRRRAAICC